MRDLHGKSRLFSFQRQLPVLWTRNPQISTLPFIVRHFKRYAVRFGLDPSVKIADDATAYPLKWAAAEEIFENEYIDLGIIDVMMPIMDGFELVENLKEFKDVPVIMLTAKGESKDKLRGFSVGADDRLLNG